MITNQNIILYALIALSVFLFAWNIKTEIRMRKIFAGKKAKDLEDVIISLVNEAGRLEKSEGQIKDHIENIEGRLKRSIQGVETVRFNALRDTGGNQSFATAFLNEEGDGAIISSIYSRERVSIFAKPIKGNKSEYELTGEEKEALSKARR